MADSYNELFGLGSHSEDANLEGWWPLQDDAASTAIDDASSNANDGTLNGGDNTADISTTGPNSWLTKGLDFDGSNDYISVSGTELDLTGAFTIGEWFSREASMSNKTIMGFYQASSPYSGYGLAVGTNSTNRPDVWSKGTAGWTTINTALNLSTWYLLIGKHDGSTTVSISIDAGTPTTGTKDPPDSYTGTKTIGARADAAQKAASKHSHAFVFSRELSAAEEDEVYNGPEPVNTVAPVLSGTEEVGETLSCTTGTWGLDSPFSSGSNGTITYSYQWTRSNDSGGTGEADISGATSSTYTLVEADVGKFIRCRVRATNDGGYDSAADTNSNMSGAISSVASVSPDDSTHAHSADSPTITQTHSIAPDDATHSHAADSPAVSQVHTITPDSCTHAHSADPPAISQVHAVSPAECLHGHTAESPTVAETAGISPNDATHAHTADSPAITQTHAISPDEALHGHSAESPALVQVHVISPDEAAHGHAADSPTITQTHVVSSDETTHAHTAESPVINLCIYPDDSTHTHTADSPAISQVHAVVPADCLHSHTAGSPTVAGDFVAFIDSRANTRLFDSRAEARVFDSRAAARKFDSRAETRD